MCCPSVPHIPCERNARTLSKNENLVLCIQFFRSRHQDRGSKRYPKAPSAQKGRCTVDEATEPKGRLTWEQKRVQCVSTKRCALQLSVNRKL